MTTTEHCRSFTKPAARARDHIRSACWLFAATTSITTRAQSEPSLGDVARRKSQAASHGPGRTSTPAAADANRLAAELEQEQEMAGAVPDGFQWYSGEGYGMSVPAPFSVEGRDEVGVLLSTAEVTGITTKVIAEVNPNHGTPGNWKRELVPILGSYGAITVPSRRKASGDTSARVSKRSRKSIIWRNGTLHRRRPSDYSCDLFCDVAGQLQADYSIRRRTRGETDNLRDEGLRNMRRREEAFASNQLCSAVLIRFA